MSRRHTARRWPTFAASLVMLAGAACSADKTAPEQPPPASTARLVLSASTTSFDAVAGGADPAEQSIDVGAADGVVSGLAARIVYANGQSGSWLEVLLSNTGAPARLILRPKIGSLSAGSYTAQVEITAPNVSNSPEHVAVTLRVAAPPLIALSRSSIAFSGQRARSSPPAEVVTISNAGGGSLTGLAVHVEYDANQPNSWLTATLSGATAPASLTLTAAVGALAAGSYTASVSVSATSPGTSSQTIAVRFEVGGTPCIALSQSSVPTSAVAGGANPASVSVLVTNSTDGALSGLAVAVSYPAGQTSGWLGASLDRTTAPAAVQLQPNVAGLASGIYTAMVAISSPVACNSPAQISVTLTVAPPAPVPAIGLSASTLSFSSVNSGTPTAAQSILITNIGTGALDGLSASITYSTSQSTAWLSATLDRTVAPATLSVRATPLLPPGVYTAAIAISAPGAANSPQLVIVTLTVERPPTIHIPYSSVSFISIPGGANPASVTVPVENVGGGSLSGLAVVVSYADAQPTGWMRATLDRTTAPATITLQPITGSLAVGVYSASLTITSPVASNSVILRLGFAINPLPVIGLAPSSLSFNTVRGAPNPAPQTVQISNAGSGTLGDLAARITYAGQGAGWMHVALSSTAAPSTMTVEVNAGALAAGTYTADVQVSSIQGVAPRAITVSLTITEPQQLPIIGVSPDPVPLTLPEGGNLSGPQISVHNDGGGSLTGLSVKLDFPSTQAPIALGVWLASAEAPTTVEMKSDTRTLKVGHYTATLTVSSALAGVAPRVVPLTIDVRQSGAVISLAGTSASFAVVQGAASPAPLTIAVTNGGTDVLSGLTASVDYTSGAAGWLSAAIGEGDLPVNTAPVNLRLTATTPSLAAGTYTATVTVSSALQGVGPRTVAVSLTVSPAIPRTITLSPASVSFAAMQGAANPAFRTVSISDAGASIAGLVVSTPSYAAGQPTGWLTVTLSSTATPSTLTLQPTTSSLGAGTYTATVLVSSPNATNSPQSVAITLTITAQSYTLTTATSPSNGGTITRSPNQNTYTGGTIVTLTARPNVGWQLARWTGDASGAINPLSVQMNGNKAITAELELKPPVLTVPSQATGAIAFSWTYLWPCVAAPCLASSNDRYELEERTGTAAFAVVATPSSFDHASPFAITLTRSAGTYSYRVRAITMYGASAYSDVKTVVVAQPTLAAPANLAAIVVSASQIDLTWSDAVTNEDGFRVERCSGTGCTDFVQVASIAANGTTYSSRSLTSGTPYSYRVRAFRGSELSAYSNVATAITAQAVTATAFQNNTAWAVISLVIDGVEQVTIPGYGIPSAKSATLALAAGSHNYTAITGYWDGSTRVPMYTKTNSFTQAVGVVSMVTFNNPSIAQILTTGANSLKWEGSYFDDNLIDHVKTFRFYNNNNGSCEYYFDLARQPNCTVTTTSYVAGLVDFRITYSDGRPAEAGTYYELLGYFVMSNGVRGALVQYTNTFNP